MTVTDSFAYSFYVLLYIPYIINLFRTKIYTFFIFNIR